MPGAAAGGIALVGYTMMQRVFYGGFRLAASRPPLAARGVGLVTARQYLQIVHALRSGGRVTEV